MDLEEGERVCVWLMPRVLQMIRDLEGALEEKIELQLSKTMAAVIKQKLVRSKTKSFPSTF